MDGEKIAANKPPTNVGPSSVILTAGDENPQEEAGCCSYGFDELPGVVTSWFGSTVLGSTTNTDTKDV